MGGMKPNGPDEFLAKICTDSRTGCWLWNGAKFENGYGAFSYRNKTVRAHRWSYNYWVGPIPDGLLVCHRCDTPACVNPDHLFVGTQRDNLDDREQKGRTLRGENHPRVARPGQWGDEHTRERYRQAAMNRGPEHNRLIGIRSGAARLGKKRGPYKKRVEI